MSCEDFPCCGHEAGCCPDFDASGRQLNMKCTCGAVLPLSSRYSICNACLHADDDMGDEDYGDDAEDSDDQDYEPEMDYDYDGFGSHSDFDDY